jgi:hypothetical protein
MLNAAERAGSSTRSRTSRSMPEPSEDEDHSLRAEEDAVLPKAGLAKYVRRAPGQDLTRLPAGVWAELGNHRDAPSHVTAAGPHLHSRDVVAATRHWIAPFDPRCLAQVMRGEAGVSRRGSQSPSLGSKQARPADTRGFRPSSRSRTSGLAAAFTCRAPPSWARTGRRPRTQG